MEALFRVRREIDEESGVKCWIIGKKMLSMHLEISVTHCVMDVRNC